MNFQKALQHKKHVLKMLEEMRPYSNDELVIVPFRAKDLERFLEYFKNNPKKVNDYTCLLFSSDLHFMVYRVSADGLFLHCRE